MNTKIDSQKEYLSWLAYGAKNNQKPYSSNNLEQTYSNLDSAAIDTKNDFKTQISNNITDIWSHMNSNISQSISNGRGTIASVIEEVSKNIGATIISTGETILTSSTIESVMATLDNCFAGTTKTTSNIISQTADYTKESLRNIMTSWSNVDGKDTFTGFSSFIISALSVFSDSLANYIDGIEETTFGARMSKSWSGSSTSFLDTFKNSSRKQYNVKFLYSTPLDSGSSSENLYGSMILGAPPLFNNVADPNHRSLVNTILKDSKFLSLTPGLPFYNGSSYLSAKNNSYDQTPNGQAMIEYLLKNGIDSNFQSKDKRYYTFRADYKNYFAYLETMLNTIWIKLGLATDDNSTFNIYSFFDIGEDSTNVDLLKPQYNSSLGFFVNPSGIVSESVDSSPTNFGQNLKSTSESFTDDYQLVNFLSGAGLGGATRNAARTVKLGFETAKNLGAKLVDTMSGAISGFRTGTKLATKTILALTGAAKDIGRFSTEEDLGAQLQSFATTNGMRTFYPELWSDSSYNRTININFEFISPYGDPLSIFQNVFVPFCALACFAFPRQAADNGLVSPFFVRADVPGVFTCDFGLITNFTFRRGGDNELWTVDGLPRAISGTFSITDLYQYVAMTKRLSFMSANPSYTVFLDSFCGLRSIYSNDDEAILNNYFKQLINRVSGEDNAFKTGLWNEYGSYRKISNKNMMNKLRKNSLSNKGKNIYWMNSIH